MGGTQRHPLDSTRTRTPPSELDATLNTSGANGSIGDAPLRFQQDIYIAAFAETMRGSGWNGLIGLDGVAENLHSLAERIGDERLQRGSRPRRHPHPARLTHTEGLAAHRRPLYVGPVPVLEPVPEGWASALAVVAHPDDMEYGAAAAVARWTGQGKHISYVLVTDGEAGISTMEPDEVGPVRRAEQVAACRAVGVEDVEFLGLPDGLVEEGIALRRATVPTRRSLPPVVQQRAPLVSSFGWFVGPGGRTLEPTRAAMRRQPTLLESRRGPTAGAGRPRSCGAWLVRRQGCGS